MHAVRESRLEIRYTRAPGKEIKGRRKLESRFSINWPPTLDSAVGRGGRGDQGQLDSGANWFMIRTTIQI
eukprot:13236228-Heterocapsa_arctica.AAC.1